jgi:hypothetical protein
MLSSIVKPLFPTRFNGRWNAYGDAVVRYIVDPHPVSYLDTVPDMRTAAFADPVNVIDCEEAQTMSAPIAAVSLHVLAVVFEHASGL